MKQNAEKMEFLSLCQKLFYWTLLLYASLIFSLKQKDNWTKIFKCFSLPGSARWDFVCWFFSEQTVDEFLCDGPSRRLRRPRSKWAWWCRSRSPKAPWSTGSCSSPSRCWTSPREKSAASASTTVGPEVRGNSGRRPRCPDWTNRFEVRPADLGWVRVFRWCTEERSSSLRTRRELVLLRLRVVGKTLPGRIRDIRGVWPDETRSAKVSWSERSSDWRLLEIFHESEKIFNWLIVKVNLI